MRIVVLLSQGRSLGLQALNHALTPVLGKDGVSSAINDARFSRVSDPVSLTGSAYPSQKCVDKKEIFFLVSILEFVGLLPIS